MSETKTTTPLLGFALISHRVLRDGQPVGYMYREEGDNDDDSGWRFFAGDEDEAYTDNPDNFSVVGLDTVVSLDEEVQDFLEADYGSQFARDGGDHLHVVEE